MRIHRKPMAWKSALFVVLAAIPASAQESGRQVESEKTKEASGIAVDTSPKSAEARERQFPSWVAESRWYEIHVPRFHNGEKSNDPPQTAPWLGDWPIAGQDTGKLDEVAYGGDLQGLKARLGYVKDLGFNALLLTGCFAPRVDNQSMPVLAASIASGATAQANASAPDSGSSAFTSNDRILLDLISEAHRNGMRIALQVPFGTIENASQETNLITWTRRWMDPDGDGDAKDGPDGWAIAGTITRPWPEPVFHRWTELMGQLNKNAVTLEVVPPHRLKNEISDNFDLRIQHSTSYELHRMLSAPSKPTGPTDFWELMRALEKFTTPHTMHGTLHALGPVHESRFLSYTGETGKAPDTAVENLTTASRLALIVQHFMPGQPITLYGDEVGMTGGEDALSRGPMWWPDLPEAATKLSNFKSDFSSLIRWLNEQRAMRIVMREGTFRTVLNDPENQILALSRSLPGDDLILLVNYGKEKRKVMLPCGKPNTMIGLLIPNLGPQPPSKNAPQKPTGPAIPAPPLRVNGSRQVSNNEGKIRVWIGPMSARLVIVKDAGPS